MENNLTASGGPVSVICRFSEPLQSGDNNCNRINGLQYLSPAGLALPKRLREGAAGERGWILQHIAKSFIFKE
jgi:hypothetical protein